MLVFVTAFVWKWLKIAKTSSMKFRGSMYINIYSDVFIIYKIFMFGYLTWKLEFPKFVTRFFHNWKWYLLLSRCHQRLGLNLLVKQEYSSGLFPQTVCNTKNRRVSRYGREHGHSFTETGRLLWSTLRVLSLFICQWSHQSTSSHSLLYVNSHYFYYFFFEKRRQQKQRTGIFHKKDSREWEFLFFSQGLYFQNYKLPCQQHSCCETKWGKYGEGHRTNCHEHQRAHSEDGVTQA